MTPSTHRLADVTTSARKRRATLAVTAALALTAIAAAPVFAEDNVVDAADLDGRDLDRRHLDRRHLDGGDLDRRHVERAGARSRSLGLAALRGEGRAAPCAAVGTQPGCHRTGLRSDRILVAQSA